MSKFDIDTIAAISTPPGTGGVGIIKISGPGAFLIIKKVFMPSSNKKPWQHPRRMCHGFFCNPDSSTDRIDEVLCVCMPCPSSYTGEDVAEIQSHGGVFVLNQILDVLLTMDIRMAQPGEFSKRAFLNGRIDLTRAEAVIDIINASSKKALSAAQLNLNGGLRDEINRIIRDTTGIAAIFEAAIDFPEEMDEVDIDSIISRIESQIKAPLEKLFFLKKTSEVLRYGLKIVIAGRPNVGKSSLLNLFMGRDRAIVTDIPGTTRDIIAETINLEGLTLQLIDTAGIRDSNNKIELAGIELTYEMIDLSHLCILMMDVTEPPGDDERELFLRIKNKPYILLLNKIDLQSNYIDDYLKLFTKDRPVLFSTKTMAGFSELSSKIKMAFDSYDHDCEDNQALPNIRHLSLIEEAMDAGKAALCTLKNNTGIELASDDLKHVLISLGQITGTIISDDILDRIFSDFCIGK